MRMHEATLSLLHPRVLLMFEFLVVGVIGMVAFLLIYIGERSLRDD